MQILILIAQGGPEPSAAPGSSWELKSHVQKIGFGVAASGRVRDGNVRLRGPWSSCARVLPVRPPHPGHRRLRRRRARSDGLWCLLCSDLGGEGDGNELELLWRFKGK